jgi:hypothetical protein
MQQHTDTIVIYDAEQRQIIELCEQLLLRARNGEITSIAMACISVTGATSTCWSTLKGVNGVALIGALSCLQHRLLDHAL